MIVKGIEVFRRVGTRSVRGIVSQVNEDNLVVVWSVDEKSIQEVVPNTEVANLIYEDEKELVRAEGTKLLSLAAPRKIYLKSAKSFYGTPINEGDFVIAMADEALYHKFEGTVRDIYYLSNIGYSVQFMDLVDADGKLVVSQANAICFAVPEEFMEDVEEA